MSSFIVPIVDPDSPRFQTFPDNIRGSTVEGFLLRDRFVYATSRRLIWSLPPIYRSSFAPAFVFQGSAVSSPYLTGNIWIVGRGGNGTITIDYGGTTINVFPNGVFPGTAWAAKVASTVLPNTTNNITISVTRTAGSPAAFGLLGLSVYEEILSSADLP